MARTKAPVLSYSAAGQLGPLTHQHVGPGLKVARKTPYPAQPRSWAQRYHRIIYRYYTTRWRLADPAYKESWRPTASRLGLPLMAAYLRTMLRTMPDIVCWYHMDEGEDIDLQDSGRNGIVAYNTLCGPVIAPFKSGMGLGGSVSYFKTDQDSRLGTHQDFTVSFWFAWGGAGIHEWQFPADCNQVWRLAYTKSNPYLTLYVRSGGQQYTVVQATTPLEVGVYHHWVITYTGDWMQGRIYLDGELHRSAVGPGALDVGGNRLWIGTSYGQNAMVHGNFDEYLYISRILSPDEVADLHQSYMRSYFATAD